MFIISTTQAQHLTKGMKGIKGLELVFPDFNKEGERYFPDGEIYAKIGNAKRLQNKRVVVLHSGAPNPNEGLVELELILQILRDWKAKPIEVFFTYFPYGMQDSVFEKGETNVAENLIEKLVKYYNVKKIYIVDAHFWGREWAKRYPIIHISTVPLLIEAAKKDFGKNILFSSPDKGGERRTGVSGMKKKRKNSYDVEIESSDTLKKLMRDRTVAVIDDILKTGGTLDKFYEECKKNGAKKIVALLTHGVLRSGITRTKKKYSKLYLTNTINRKEANINITALILNSISPYIDFISKP